MRRRRWLLGSLFLSAALAVVAQCAVWHPLSHVPTPTIPLPAAALRTSTEHDAVYSTAAFPYVVDIAHGAGHLVFVGIQHTIDPADPQLRAFDARFDALQPTQVLVEGELGWAFGGRAALVAQFGESGHAAWRAHASGVPVASLEPTFADEAADAAQEFGAARTVAFYFLRVYQGDRDRGELGADADAAAARLLAKRATRAGHPDVFLDLAAFERFWATEFPAGPAWRMLPPEALWRTRDGTWLNQLAERVNSFRDRHMVRVLRDAMSRGERVLAVAGASHVVIQEPLLRAPF